MPPFFLQQDQRGTPKLATECVDEPPGTLKDVSDRVERSAGMDLDCSREDAEMADQGDLQKPATHARSYQRR
jgi:hypothetical protein